MVRHDWASLRTLTTLTSLTALITDKPSQLSRPRSRRLTATMRRSKMFQPLWKYFLPRAVTFSTASSKKKVVKT